MQRRTTAKALGSSLAAAALLAGSMAGAQAYNPTGGTLYQLGTEPCLKGRGNCAVYPKSAQLPSGRPVAAFEKSTVVTASGSADGQSLRRSTRRPRRPATAATCSTSTAPAAS